jgi:group I intron endonuclease
MAGIIYAYRNRINGKHYVGQTTAPRRRHSRHLSGKSGSRVFNAAVRKYGPEAFIYEVLVADVPDEDLNNWEQYFIWLMGAFGHGYNLTPGGGSRSTEQNARASESTRTRHQRMTQEQRESISEKCRQRALAQWAEWREGRGVVPKRKMTKEKADKIFAAINRKIRKAHAAAARIAKAQHKRPATKSVSRGRRVLVLELGVKFDTALQAARATRCEWIAVKRACSRGDRGRLPYTFRYSK